MSRKPIRYPMKIKPEEARDIFDLSRDNDLMSVLLKYLEIVGMQVPFNTRRIHLTVVKVEEDGNTIDYEVRIIRFGQLFMVEVYNSHESIMDIELAQTDKKRGRPRMCDKFLIVGSQWNWNKSKLTSIFSGYRNEIKLTIQQAGRNPKNLELVMKWSEKGKSRGGKVILVIPLKDEELNEEDKPIDKLPLTYPWVDVSEEIEQYNLSKQDIETEQKQPDKKEKNVEMFEDGLGEEEPEEEE